MTFLQALLIAIIEGITEFLPISSTAHMRIAESMLQLSEQDEFIKLFTVVIQFGAILSVVVLYFKKFIDFRRKDFYIKLLIAVIPSLIIGKLIGDWIDSILENIPFIAIIMILGGIVLLFIDKLFKNTSINNETEITYATAFKIGLFQCLAIVFPGLSRSAATIIGGMSQKLTRTLAAEFSFFLAVPTMFAATVYKTYKYIHTFGMFTTEQFKLIAIGNMVAFIVALLVIKFFIDFVKKNGLKMWGYYRICLGVIVLVLFYLNIVR